MASASERNYFFLYSQAYCSDQTQCLRWNKCQMVQGRFAGMCGMSRFHVCCLLTESENDSVADEDPEFLKGPAPPEEYLVSSEEDILDTFSALARNAVEIEGTTEVIEDNMATTVETTTPFQVSTEKTTTLPTTIYVTPNTEDDFVETTTSQTTIQATTETTITTPATTITTPITTETKNKTPATTITTPVTSTTTSTTTTTPPPTSTTTPATTTISTSTTTPTTTTTPSTSPTTTTTTAAKTTIATTTTATTSTTAKITKKPLPSTTPTSLNAVVPPLSILPQKPLTFQHFPPATTTVSSVTLAKLPRIIPEPEGKSMFFKFDFFFTDFYRFSVPSQTLLPPTINSPIAK